MTNRNRIRKRLNELKGDDMNGDQWTDYMEEVALALGWFIVSFNDLDFEVTGTITELAALGNERNQDITFTLMSSKSFSQKVKDLEMMLYLAIKGKPNEAELHKSVKHIVEGIKLVNSERNALVHANWYDTEQDGNDTIVNFKTGIDKLGFYHEYFKCSPEHIEGLEEQCEKLTKELEIFATDLKRP